MNATSPPRLTVGAHPRHTKLLRAVERAQRHLDAELAWIATCGQTMTGYRENYGDSGDGWRAIYDADQQAAMHYLMDLTEAKRVLASYESREGYDL